MDGNTSECLKDLKWNYLLLMKLCKLSLKSALIPDNLEIATDTPISAQFTNQELMKTSTQHSVAVPGKLHVSDY